MSIVFSYTSLKSLSYQNCILTYTYYDKQSPKAARINRFELPLHFELFLMQLYRSLFTRIVISVPSLSVFFVVESFDYSNHTTATFYLWIKLN